MLLQQQLEKIMRKKKFSKLVSSCQYYCLLGTVHTTSSAGGFDFGKFPRLFYLLPHRQSSTANSFSRNSVLLSHHAAGGKPEDGNAARKALSQSEQDGTDFNAGW